MISDLVDYLHNNLLIAHFCGFDISRPLPSYWTFDRFLKNFDNKVLSEIMKTQVLFLSKEGIVDTSFIGLDSTLSLQILHRIIRNLFSQISLNPEINQGQIRIVNSASTLHPIKRTRKNMNSIGAIKIMSL